LLGLLLPKKDYEVDDIIFWAAMVDGGMWYGVWLVVAAALLSTLWRESGGNWRPPFPLRWFGWRALSRLSFAA
jgi:hypothetical protein